MKQLVCLSLILISVVLAAQEDALQQSRDVLHYGIDSEVIELLDQLEDQMEERLDQEILQRFAESRNRTLQGRILEHFENRELDIAGEAVAAILTSDVELDNTFMRTAVRYLSDVAHVRSPELLARYEELATGDDLVAASVAIGAIGADGSDGAIQLLFTLYDDLRSDELRGSVLRALGDAGSEQATDMLVDILTDPYEESTLRDYAAESLGKIGSPEGLPALLYALEDENSLLRAYATAALGAYDDPDATAALETGLRDSFWRVRVAALQGIARRQSATSLPAIEYKARRDPESPVRQEALRTLAALDLPESYDVLRAIALEAALPQADRLLAIQLLIEDDLASSMDAVAQIIDTEWDVENSRLLDGTARALNETSSELPAAIYAHLLDHPNYIIRVYGIRGIGRSGLSQYADAIDTIARRNATGLLRTAAATTLEQLGLPVPEPDGAHSDNHTDSTAPEADAPGVAPGDPTESTPAASPQDAESNPQ